MQLYGFLYNIINSFAVDLKLIGIIIDGEKGKSWISSGVGCMTVRVGTRSGIQYTGGL